MRTTASHLTPVGGYWLKMSDIHYRSADQLMNDTHPDDLPPSEEIELLNELDHHLAAGLLCETMAYDHQPEPADTTERVSNWWLDRADESAKTGLALAHEFYAVTVPSDAPEAAAIIDRLEAINSLTETYNWMAGK